MASQVSKGHFFASGKLSGVRVGIPSRCGTKGNVPPCPPSMGALDENSSCCGQIGYILGTELSVKLGGMCVSINRMLVAGRWQ